jgi:hypothetical protein
MRDKNYILKFLVILFIAFGCGSQRTGDEVSNETWLASEHPNSPIKSNYEENTEDSIQSEPEDDVDDPTPPAPIEEEQPEETVAEEPEEPEEEPEEQPEVEAPLDEPEDEDEEETNSCFSYLDCPNHEACNAVSSTCFLCTEGWHCNNYFDQQQTGPSFCCTPEDVDNQRCDLVGTCKE